MDKIGIITLNGYYNYGNRLQNYATQEVLKSLGFSIEAVIINNDTILKTKKNSKLFKRVSKLIHEPIDALFWKINKKIFKCINNELINQRMKIFKKFTEEYILEREYNILEDEGLKDLCEIYSYFIVGSDQVWNPDNIRSTPIYFLTFAERNKRISFAPSFGVSKIPSEWEKDYKIWLSGMHRLSVREETGAEIIKKLTGKDATVLVDPTLLLSKEKWLSISKESINKPKNKYILTYFLGDVPYKRRKIINSIAKKNNLEVINLADIRDKKTYLAGPSEFIDYINSASVLFTDSFHGCVFSILLETPFVVYERIGSTSMYSRIDTLLSKFQLESRKAENIKTMDEIFKVDYSHIPPILEAERKKAFDYLKEALNVEEVKNED